MTYYVPGTEETDLKKVIMSLQQAASSAATSADKLANFILITDYGGVGDGTTANDTALAAAWAAQSTTGVDIYFPPGKFKFTAAFAKTFPNSKFGLSIVGAGSTATTLYWPNAAGGMTFTQTNVENSIHLRGFSVTTGVTNGGTGISLVGVATSSKSVWSSIDDVEIKGDDGGGQTFYWTTAYKTHCWSLINYTIFNTYGSSTGQGDGIVVEGQASGSIYNILHNFKTISPNYHNFGFTCGDWVQGVTVTGGSNFNGNVGLAAIYNPAGCTGILAQLTVSDSQFNYGGDQISINSGLNQLKVCNNVITVSGNNHTGVFLPIASDFTIVGNSFNLAGTPTTTTGVTAGPPGFGLIDGNNFQGYALGINLLVGATNVTIPDTNTYSSVGLPILNNGPSALTNRKALQASVASATGTTSATQVMMGLGSTFKLTPGFSTRVNLTISGDLFAASAVLGSLTVMYGTGTAPVNGAASAGTQVGSVLTAVPDAVATQFPFSKTVIVTGLVPGTAYWFDVKLSSNNGVSVALGPTDCAVFEF